jgi:hypothetical protein
MGLFDRFKKKPEVEVKEAPKVEPKEPKPKKKSEKDIATEKGLPWVSVVQVELDPDNIGNGAFELDWNEKFIVNLIKSGYQGKTDQDIVDRWFQDVCRNVVLENYEQWEANQPTDARPRVVDRRDIGDGRTEVS